MDSNTVPIADLGIPIDSNPCYVKLDQNSNERPRVYLGRVGSPWNVPLEDLEEVMIQPIETLYAGCRFRSRLEARWAVFFDAIKINWEYEPEGFETPHGRYLPDFRVSWNGRMPGTIDKGRFGLWLEIKGAKPNTDLLQREQWFALNCANPRYYQIIYGEIPNADSVEQPGLHGLCHLWDGWWDTRAGGQIELPVDLTTFRAGLTRARSARFEHGETPERPVMSGLTSNQESIMEMLSHLIPGEGITRSDARRITAVCSLTDMSAASFYRAWDALLVNNMIERTETSGPIAKYRLAP